jgi:hypothetical protein
MPPSEDELKVTPPALRAEGGKYDGLSLHMTGVKITVADLGLSASAFFVGDPLVSQAMSKSYNDLHAMMSMIVDEAATEFQELAGALRRAADEYERTDGQNSADLSKIYGN